MNDNGIGVVLSIGTTDATNLIADFLNNLPFKPSRMRPALLHKNAKYNIEQFITALKSGIDTKTHCSATIDQDRINTVCIRYDGISDIITLILHSNDYSLASKILNLCDDVIKKHSIISGYLRNKLDMILSSETQISFFEYKGIDTTNLKKIIDPVFNKEIIDIEQFSGHSHEYGGIEFTSTYLMWFGKDFFRFVPQETLTSFKDCVSNETFDNGTVRIQLYEDINDFNTAETDRRQWAFRKHTNIDKVAEEWNKEYLAMASKDKSGANMTIENGHFEHGGVKLMKLYLDKDNNTTTKRHAVKVKCVEYDSAGNVVFDDILSV